jgi:hypothetical protein
MKLHGYLSYWKKPQSNLRLLEDKSTGTLAGEGSVFFMLSGAKKADNPVVTVEGLHTFFTRHQADSGEIAGEIRWFLHEQKIRGQEIDCIMLGLNGDYPFDRTYYTLRKECFNNETATVYFKHLCGEYYTASAFALWLGSVILEQQEIPDQVKLTGKAPSGLNNLLIYNHIRNSEHSLILLKYGKL